MRKPATIHAEPTEAEIQHAAYLLWIEEGQPEGCDLAHWLAAKELLRHRHGHSVGRARRLLVGQPAPFPAQTATT
jgi:hypothetical protein